MAEAATRLISHIKDNPDTGPTDLAFSLLTSRASFEHRAVAVGESREELIASLADLAEGKESKALARGRARTEQRPLFLFPGQGAQAAGMATGLLDSSPAFAEHMQECEAALAPHVDWSLTEVLREEDAAWLDRLDIVQPALFAVMVSLARLWRQCGVEPQALIGHSQGEIAAAHIAGALSLEDAALIVAKRGSAMAKIAGEGAMLSVSLKAEELPAHTEPFGERISLAAINGPASLVCSGEPEALAELEQSLEEKGIRAKPIAVDYAAHSVQIEALKEELLEAFAPISPRATEIPLISTVTAGLIEGAELGPEYWYRNLRQTVLLEPVLRAQLEAGKRAFIEIGPHPVLAFGVEETFDRVLEDPTDATLLASLRREEDEPRRFALSLAEAHAKGIEVGWHSFFKGSGAKRVPLPTYPFQRKRYWLSSGNGTTDAASIGLTASDHPLLSAAIEDPAGEGLTLTGRISLATHPWLADHAVAGSVLFPGTAFLELALRAAEEVGAQSVGELATPAPLMLAESGAVAIRVSVSGPDEGGNREIQVYSRPDEDEAEWTLNAAGALSPEPGSAPEPLGIWPPEGAEPLELEHVYDVLAEHGLEYGPAFQGLDAVWRLGEETYVQASLPEAEAQGAERFAVHPALLDAALQGVVFASLEEGQGQGPAMPFSWSGVSVNVAGAMELRVRFSLHAQGDVSLDLLGVSGAPVGRVDSLAVRALDPSKLQDDRRKEKSLFVLTWNEVSLPEPEEATVETLRPEIDAEPAADRAALALTREALAEIQRRLVEGPEEARLAFITQGAMAVAEGESPDPAAAALWGLVRSAISEHPGRFALIDSDGSEASEDALEAALALGQEEPQLALREGVALVPRLARLESEGEGEETPPLDPERTVLITGATGDLGALTARHLAEHHGARRLLLLSRSGPQAEGAKELQADLEALGAEAQILACDVSDREALREAIAQIPPEHPLGAVFHCAGALADGTIESLDADGMEYVFSPKASAAWHLHEMTQEADLDAFVLFSSAAGLLGGAAQANYAAANVFCDALAQRRHAEGMPATSLAWGLWDRVSGTAGEEIDHLLEREEVMARLREQVRQRLGFDRMTVEQGLQLFDLALAGEEPLLAPVRFDTAALRARARAGALAPIMSGLVRVPARRGTAKGDLVAKLTEVPEAERQELVLNLVRTHVAAALGYVSASEVEPTRAFGEMGLDSLGAVEVRNRLVAATGLRIGTTVVFDYPNATALATHLLAEASGGTEIAQEQRGGEVRNLLAKLETTLSSLEPSDRIRERASARLRSLLVSLDDADSSDGGEADGDLTSMSDEEMFELIDEEFGGTGVSHGG